MNNFWSAFHFLTVLPGPKEETNFNERMVFWFPLAGLTIGVMLCGVDYLGSLVLFDQARACVDVLFLVCITGGLHMDGLGDTADGVFSHKDRVKILEIMKDPRMGVMGTLAIVFCVILKISGATQFSFAEDWLWLVLIPGLARCSQVLGLAFMKNARGEESLGAPLYSTSKFTALGWSVVFLSISFLIGWKTGLLTVFVFIAVNGILFGYFARKIDGMTGDTFGALTEIVEAALFLLGGALCHRII